nr:POTRA domain-containing protein [Duganella sp. Leaf126]
MFSLVSAGVSAQTYPGNSPTPPVNSGSLRDDAGLELIRQQERERVLRQQQEAASDVRLQADAAPTAANRLPQHESPCFTIDQLLLGGPGAEAFAWARPAADRDDLGQADAPLGRCLGTTGINIVMGRLQNAIIARGYATTRVLAEPQDLSRGTLALSILPGRIRQIGFAPGTSARATWRNAVRRGPVSCSISATRNRRLKTSSGCRRRRRTSRSCRPPAAMPNRARATCRSSGNRAGPCAWRSVSITAARAPPAASRAT